MLKVLPLEFGRKQAIVIAKEIGIPQRRADSYLKILVEQGKIMVLTRNIINRHAGRRLYLGGIFETDKSIPYYSPLSLVKHRF